MAPVKLKAVVSFSSQDPDHCASNLLEMNQWRRWLCAPSDRSGSVQVEFQLEKAVKIGFIDIGNYGSALIELQVRRSSSDEQFKTIVPTTSCMTPMDSKLSKNKTAVRMFTRDQLCEDVRDDLWDRLKVTCRQPFKKDAQYGLAFIKISSVEDSSVEREKPVPQKAVHTVIKPHVREEWKQQRKPNILSPSWKSNTAFQKTFANINKEENAKVTGMKDRLLKIESTSEQKAGSSDSLGRAAKLLLAASERKGHSSPILPKPTASNENSITSGPTPPSTGSTTKTPVVPSSKASKPSSSKGPRRKKDRVSVLDAPPDASSVLFEEQVREFLAHIGPGLKDATLTELRPKFEGSLGRKLDKSERATFKRLAIHAVESLDDPAGTDVPDIGLRRTSKKENGWLQAKPTPSIHTKRTFDTPKPTVQTNHARASPVQNSDPTKVKGRQLPPWMNSSPPASVGQPCPKCNGKFPAYAMNIHILDCKGKGTPPSTSSLDRRPSSVLKRHAENSGIASPGGTIPLKKHIGGLGDRTRMDISGTFAGVTSDFSTGRGRGKTRGRGGGKTRGRGRGGRGGQQCGGGVGNVVDNAAEATDANSTPGRGKRGKGRGAKSRGRGRGQASTGSVAASSPMGGSGGARGRGAGRGRGRGRGRGGGKGAPTTPEVVLHDYSSDSSDSSNDSYSMLSNNLQRTNNPAGSNGRGRGRGAGRGRGRGRGGDRGAPITPEFIMNDYSSDSSNDSYSMLSNNHQGTNNPTGSTGGMGMSFDLVPCPICMQEYPQCDIAMHAALCGDTGGGGGMPSGGFVQDVAPVWLD